MSNYREIVTKAVIGKAKKTSTNKVSVKTDEVPNTILGCWVINNSFNGINNNGVVDISGSYDINVWYSYDNDTKTAVTTKKYNYNDKMNVSINNDKELDSHKEIIVRSLKQPTVSNVEINNGEVNLTIEKEMGVEIVGNTKVKIVTEDFDDDYEEVLDSSIEEELNEINEDYLESENVE